MLRTTLRTACAIAVLAACATPAAGQRVVDDLVSIDPANVDFDFFVQGEYLGKIAVGDKPTKLGVQVIARGKGTFAAVGYWGGLPGAGWDGVRDARLKFEGANDGPVTRLKLTSEGKPGNARGIAAATIEYQQLTLRDAAGGKLGKLERVQRRSPTLGKKPPAGAVVLFDGTTDEHFKGAPMDEHGRLPHGQTSLENFGAGHLHLEFLLPYMPQRRGQGRGNSGCYLQGRHEVQVLDSFGLEGRQDECGGIYSVKGPDVNMCFPPLVWQTYDIDYTPAQFDAGGAKTAPARMTVRHNGVLIQDDVAVVTKTGWTTAAPNRTDNAEPGPVYLQNHSCPVRYRNIWFVPAK